MLTVAGLFWLMVTTHALLVGAWNTWEQYFLGPIPVAMGLFLATYPINSAYAVVFLIFVIVFMSYEITLAAQLKSQLLVFNPRMVLKFVSKGLILVFSISSAILVVIHAGKEPSINIGNAVGEFVDEHFSFQATKQLNSQYLKDLSPEEAERLSAFGLDPSLLTNPKVIEGDPTEALKELQNRGLEEISLKNAVAKEVNKLVEPYKRFLNPVIAILIFGLIQFLGTISYLFYSLFVGLIFQIAKKTGFFKIETVPAEKETLHF